MFCGVSMITMYHQIAVRLRKIGLLLWSGLLISFFLCGYVVFADSTNYSSDQQLAFFVLSVWFLSMVVLMNLFIEPARSTAVGDGLFKRIKTRVGMTFRWVVAVVFSLATLLLFYLSIRAIMFYL